MVAFADIGKKVGNSFVMVPAGSFVRHGARLEAVFGPIWLGDGC